MYSIANSKDIENEPEREKAEVRYLNITSLFDLYSPQPGLQMYICAKLQSIRFLKIN